MHRSRKDDTKEPERDDLLDTRKILPRVETVADLASSGLMQA
jgi:hypothetical protein